MLGVPAPSDRRHPPQALPRNVLYLSYGDGPHVQEVRYSIISAWRFGPPEDDGVRVIIYTDRPEAFDDLPVSVRAVAPSEWSAWSGAHGYAHRRKIIALEHAYRECDGLVILLDGDTVWLQPPGTLFERVAPGRAVMHKREGALHRGRDSISRQVRRILAGLGDRVPAGASMPPSTHMWNAGVVGVHRDDAACTTQVLAWTDAMCGVSTDVHVLEQLAFSHVLAQRGCLVESADVVFHYWPRRLRLAIGRHIAKLSTPAECRDLQQLAERFHARIPRPALQPA